MTIEGGPAEKQRKSTRTAGRIRGTAERPGRP